MTTTHVSDKDDQEISDTDTPDGYVMRVYRYGLLAPIEGAGIVDQQMLLAHRYRNTLVEIERGRRAALRLVHAQHGHTGQIEADFKAAETVYEQVVALVKAARSSAKSRAIPADLKAQLTAAKTVMSAARNRLQEHRRALREDPVVVAESDRIQRLATEIQKSAREHSGVYWGTYLLVEDAVTAMRKAPLYDGVLPNDPIFARWEGVGTVGIQIQGGADAADLHAGTSYSSPPFGPLSEVDRQARREWPPATWLAGTPVVERVRRWRAKPEAERLRDARPRVEAHPDGPVDVERVMPCDAGAPSVAALHAGSQPYLQIDAVSEVAHERARSHRAPPDLTEGARFVRLAYPPVGWGTRMAKDERLARWLSRPEDERLRDPRARAGHEDEAPVVEGKRQGLHTLLRLRIGSSGRAPVWAVWPMTMHRPFPEGSVIKRAAVHLRKIGPRREWAADVTVAVPAGLARRYAVANAATRDPHGAVAVDLGWRVLGDELRVCAWRGEDGRHSDLRLDARAIGGFHKAEALRGTRDENFNAARDALVTWLRERALSAPGSVPAWLTERTEHLYMWRSPTRLAALARFWAQNRFAGDEVAFGARPSKAVVCAGIRGPGLEGRSPSNLSSMTKTYESGLEGWRYHDDHLWRWESNQRAHALRHRREVYRVFAAWLATEYKTVVLEDFDLRDMARRAPAGEEKSDKAPNETARGNRHLVATSELRAAIVEAMAARGGDHEKVPAQDTTRTCHKCGVVVPFDAAASVMHTCECGATWDQDDNACIVMLARHDQLRHAVKAEPPTTNVPESRWKKVRRLAAERETRAERLQAS